MKLVQDTKVIVKIKGWNKYQRRTSGVARPLWFSLSNTLIEDEEFYDFTGEEFKAWIYILSQASKKQSSEVQINFRHADKVSNISYESLAGCLDKLVLIKAVTWTSAVHEPSTPRPQNGQHITLQYNTIQKDTSSEPTVCGAEKLFQIWNSNRKSLPEAKALNPERKKSGNSRWRENPDAEHWALVVQAIADSDFCNGRTKNSTWVADFDYFIQPKISLKFLEGKFANTHQQKPYSAFNGIAER